MTYPPSSPSVPGVPAEEPPSAGGLPAPVAYPARRLDTAQLPAEVRRPAPRPAATHAPRGATGRLLAVATVVVGGAFVLSRLLGLVRDQIILAHFGAGDRLDTYVAAFRVPDTLFALVIGGTVGSAFIPIFSQLFEQQKPDAAWRLASTLINASIVLLAAAGIVMALLAPQLVAFVIAPGFPPDKQARTVELTRIMLLSPLFLGLGGWAQGILNARHSFTASALAPVAYNCGIIAGALFLAPRWDVAGLAVGVVGGAILHFLVQMPSLVRVGMRYHPLHLDIHDEGVIPVARLMLPRVFGQAALQANFIITTAIASSLASGLLTAFNYAYLLLMLPYGVLALSMATVIFPTLAAQVGRGELDKMQGTLSTGLRTLIFMLLPTAVVLGLMSHDIVSLLFQFGNFQIQAVDLVAAALGWFAWGILAYGVVEILTRAYYALQDTRTPVVVSLVTVLLNLVLSWVLVRMLHADHTGLAFSLSFTTTLEMIGLLLWLRPRLPGLFDRGFLRAFGIAVLGAALMAGLLWVLVPWLDTYIWAYPYDAAGQKVATALRLLVGGGLGLGVYLAVARLFRAEELGMALRMLRRGR